MPSNLAKPQADWLIANLAWIRALARGLVADAQTAEDLVQETCVVAMQSEPREEQSFRGWVRTVMRNLIGHRARRDGLQRGWERLAYEESDGRSADELVEQAAMQRRLVEMVLCLDEHYRTVILLRFLEDLPPREIARRSNISVHTVKTRINRALHKLREELVRTSGANSEIWFSNLVAISIGVQPRMTPWFGISIMNTKLTIVAAALVLTGLGTASYFALTKTERPSLLSSVSIENSPEVHDLAALELPVLDLARAGATRRPAPLEATTAPSETTSETEEATQPWSVMGAVLDDLGQPLGGVTITDRATGATSSSGPNGSFELETFVNSGRIDSGSREWVTIGAGIFDRRDATDSIVVLARSIRLSGIVIDKYGESLPDVRISLHYPYDFDGRFDVRAEHTTRVTRSAQTDRNGVFELSDFPAIRGAELYCQLQGFVPAVAPIPNADGDLTITLQRPTILPEGRLRGFVYTPDGEPVPEARVAMGLDSVETDEHGEFIFDLARAATTDRLIAAKAGFLPAIVERSEYGSGGSWPEYIEVRLGGPPLRITGRVLDEEGQAVAGAHLWVDDPTPLGVDGKTPLVIESFLAGGVIPLDPLGSRRNLPEDDGENSWGPWWTPKQPTALWYWTTSDSDGRFELDGLMDRSYRIKAIEPRSLQTALSAPLEAGRTGVVVTLPLEEQHDVLEGRVVDEEGVPVVDTTLTLFARANLSDARVWGGSVHAIFTRYRESTTTDSEGRYRFENVPRKGLEITVNGGDVVPDQFQIPARVSAGGLTIEVGLRRHFKLELDELRDKVRYIEAFDESGDLVQIWQIRDNYSNSQSSFSVFDGRSPVLSIAPGTETLLLMGDGGILDRRFVGDLPRGVITILK